MMHGATGPTNKLGRAAQTVRGGARVRGREREIDKEEPATRKDGKHGDRQPFLNGAPSADTGGVISGF